MLALTMIATLIAYCSSCLGLGAIVVRAFSNKQIVENQPSAVTLLATSFILGQGILANLWLLLALAGWFSPEVVTGIVSIIALCGVMLFWRQLLDVISQIRIIGSDLWVDSWGWKIIAVLTFCLCLAWFTSIGRPLSLDGGAFHMALSKLVAATHQLDPLTGIYERFTSIGLQAEMHFAALITLGSPEAARTFDWPTILAAAVLLLALGRQVGLKRHGQWIALAMMFSSSAVIILSGFGKVDLFAVAFGLAAFYWTLQLHYEQRGLVYWLIGLMSGFAIVAKITYLVAFMPGLALVIGWAFCNKRTSDGIRNQSKMVFLQGGLQLLAGFILAISPHLIKNFILFQNPVAPFGGDAPNWVNLAWHGADTTRRILLTYPLALTYGNYYGQTGNISPLVLAFIPLTILLPKPKTLWSSPLVAVTLAALVNVLAWTIFRPVLFAPRYMLATLTLFFLPTARAAEYICNEERTPRWLSTVIMACIGITLVTTGLAYHNFIFYPAKTYQLLTGKLSECDRDAQRCEPLVMVNESAFPGTRVFTNSYQRYWLRPDLLQCLLTYDEIEAYLQLQSDEDRWDFIYSHGFRYLIDFEYVGFVFQEIPIPGDEQVPPWLLVLREQVGNTKIMRLQARDFSHETGFDCYQKSDRIWMATSPLTDSR